MLRSLALVTAFVAGSAHAAGPDGTLDTSFGVAAGHTIAPYVTDTLLGGMVASGGDRSFVVGTRPQNDSQTELLIMRLVTSTGLPDSVFGSDGNGARAIELPPGLRGPAIHAVTRQPADGKVIAVGTVDTGTAVDSALVCRFTFGGDLDTTFATTGCRTIRTFLAGEEACRARGVTTDADANVVVVGYCTGANAFARPFLARLTPTGAYDVSFFGGVFTPLVTELGYTDEQYFQSVVVTPAGKIAVAVTARHMVGDTDAGVIQFDASGNPDNTFSGDGQRMVPFDLGPSTTTRNDYAGDLLLRSNGRLLLVARARSVDAKGRLALVALGANGATDAAFGQNGVVIDDDTLDGVFLAAGDLTYYPVRAALDRFGRIVVATFERGTQGDVNDVVRRYQPNGAKDVRFGTGGSASVDHQIALGGPQRTEDHPGGLVLSGGRVIVAGIAFRPSDNLETILTYALEDGDLFMNGFE